jgi:hypothetical protein
LFDDIDVNRFCAEQGDGFGGGDVGKPGGNHFVACAYA